MSFPPTRSLVAALAALAGASGSFVLTTAVMDTLPDSVVVGLSVAIAFLAAAALFGREALRTIRSAEKGFVLWAAIAGVLAFWAAPLLVLSQRASDAPSGADSLFFTTTAWGLICVLVASAVSLERPAVTAVAGAVAALAGAAGLLASWERPSSFSPFAKFPAREALMLLAGLMFAAGLLVLAGLVRRLGARTTAVVALAGAAAVGLVVAAIPLFSAGVSSAPLLSTVYLGVTTAIFAIGLLLAVEDAGMSRGSIALLGAPVVVTLLSLVERVTGVYGPNPMHVPGVAAGALALLAALVVVWLAAAWPKAAGAPATGIARLPLLLGAGALALSTVALFTPALTARSQGGLEGGFDATWAMFGYEAAASWLVFAAAGLALAAAYLASQTGRRGDWVPSAAAALVCAVASVPLAGTTLATWNRWVPADVQQTYGTEYSTLTIAARLDVVRLVAMALAVAAVVALAVIAGRKARRDAVGTLSAESGAPAVGTAQEGSL